MNIQIQIKFLDKVVHLTEEDIKDLLSFVEVGRRLNDKEMAAWAVQIIENINNNPVIISGPLV